MAVSRIFRTVGDTRTRLGAQLVARNADKTYEAVDLTDLDVTFMMVRDDGQVIVEETSSNVQVIIPGEGKVAFDFGADQVAEAGTYYCWFRAHDGPERDTFPVTGRSFELIIKGAS